MRKKNMHAPSFKGVQENEMAYRIAHLNVMKPRQERHYRVLVWLWLLANLLFWRWWMRLAHIGNCWLYALFSLAFCYEYTLLPTMYLKSRRKSFKEDHLRE